jgi:hypothetical protein
VEQALDVAASVGMSVALMLRIEATTPLRDIRSNIEYMHTRYVEHSALLKIEVATETHNILDRIIIPDLEPGLCVVEAKYRPVMYVYNSHQKKIVDWSQLLTRRGNLTIRDTPVDTVLMAILEDQKDNELGPVRDFDGIFTYYITPDHFWNPFVNGRTWHMLTTWAAQNDKIVSLTVGPGYDDTRIRPWANDFVRRRIDGEYYDKMFNASIEACPDVSHCTLIINISDYIWLL